MGEVELWIAGVSGAGTVIAAGLAAWSARSAKDAAQASWDLARIEAGRDETAWNSLTIDLITQDLDIDGTKGQVAWAVVTNHGPHPLQRVRCRLQLADIVWGPHPIGSMGPSKRVEMTAWFPVEDKDWSNADATVRYVDSRGIARIATARGQVEIDTASVDEWIAEGQRFAERAEYLSVYERGTSEGVDVPLFDAASWAEGLASRSEPEA
jgi:hypothetical protein